MRGGSSRLGVFDSAALDLRLRKSCMLELLYSTGFFALSRRSRGRMTGADDAQMLAQVTVGSICIRRRRRRQLPDSFDTTGGFELVHVRLNLLF